MMKRTTIRRIAFLAGACIIIVAGFGAFLWFKPHRNVQAAAVFTIINARALTDEFTNAPEAANAKYLASDGNSKVLIVIGMVSNVFANQAGEAVIILKDKGSNAGISATFTKAASAQTATIKPGDIIKIKGVIAAGNSYDSALDLYENAVIIQCTVVH